MNVTYCDLEHFRDSFQNYYTFLSVVVCIFGSVTNLLNICVLTTKQMRCATNMILTGLAVADLLVMLEYIPFVFTYNQGKKLASHFTYDFAVFVIFHALFTQAFHFISCCLTVILAVWRYIAIKFPQNNNKWCSISRTKITILLTYLLCPFVCTPLYMSSEIVTMLIKVNSSGHFVSNDSSHVATNASNDVTNATIYLVNYKTDSYSKLLSFYVYSVVIKLIPCVLLTVLSFLLIVKLLEAKERKQNLLNRDAAQTRKKSQRQMEKQKQADRTTRMLLAVLLLFLMVEFPQAILGLLSHIFGKRFEDECYNNLGEALDVFTLIISSINFVLYCIMSKKFRTVFKQVFFPYVKCFAKKPKENWTSLQTLKTYV